MNNEKVKEIKKALECCANCNGQSSCKDCPIVEKCYEDENLMPRLVLTLINELESELEKEQINNLNCDTELQYKEKRIAELETLCNKTYEDLTKEIDRLENRVKELEEGIAKSMLGCEFLPECTNDKLKQFAEKVKESLEEYRLENEYFTENEPNGNLWQMNSSVFCIEVTQDGGLIDQLAKECLNETNQEKNGN